MANVEHVSRPGLLFVARWEGLRLTPYNDAAGNATVGYGHLLHMGNVTQADRDHFFGFTESGALALLAHDVDKAANVLRELVRPPFQLQYRFDAVASFVFNVGGGAFQHSTLLRLLNSGVRGDNAANELLRWDRAGGRVLAGLTRRRQAERRLYLYEDYSAS